MSTNYWKSMDPSDGYFAKIERIGEVSARLIFALSLGDNVTQVSVVEEVQWPTAQQIGDMKRKLIVFEALAEYLNAGGELGELYTVLPQHVPLVLSFKGWNYFDGGIDANGNRVHEFVSADSTKFVRWVRNDYIDTDLTLEQIEDDTGKRPSSDPEHPNQDNSDTA
jgi:hypothetical protein